MSVANVRSNLPAIYLITDRHLVDPAQNYIAVIEELLAAGIKMVQLREKDLSSAELYSYAQRLKELTVRYDSLLLINDRVDIALAVGADGVHLGGASVPIKTARSQLGRSALIGVSTHGLDEAHDAQQNGADFITCGPVFYTPSKARYGVPLGLDALKKICQQIRLPVYGLGGIKAENIARVRECDTHGAAAISALMAAKQPARAARILLQAYP